MAVAGEEKKRKMGTDCRRLFSGDEPEIAIAKGMSLRAQESTNSSDQRTHAHSSLLNLCNFSVC